MNKKILMCIDKSDIINIAVFHEKARVTKESRWLVSFGQYF